MGTLDPLGTLYLAPTPIGNLEDITLRTLRVLRSARLILAEDTRTTARLLAHYGISTRLLSYTEHNHDARVGRILETLDEGDVVLVSEAGMPGINDPGQALVAHAAAAGVRVVGLPGASAVPLAVAVSGLPIRAFTFVGFLPHGRGDRITVLRKQAAGGPALVCFETPHRLSAALADIAEVFGDRPLVVCRELTKLHEEVFRGTASDALTRFVQPRGEFTLVIGGSEGQPGERTTADELTAFLRDRAAAGLTARDAVGAAVARFGAPRRAVYSAWEALKTPPEG
jgi:16S rRNA (cytidine1402-2'-O)-methyltransferase